MTFEWDDQKNAINRRKHGIDFETAALIFDDENLLIRPDSKHSDDEPRYFAIGMVNKVYCALAVIFTERTDAIRIISARKATKKEAAEYVYYTQGD